MSLKPVAWNQVATAGSASDLFGDILPWLGLLIGFVVVGGIALYLIRKHVNSITGVAAEPFTLEGLRRMRAAGQITDDEFEKARAALIARLKGVDQSASQNDGATEASDASTKDMDNAAEAGESGNDANTPESN